MRQANYTYFHYHTTFGTITVRSDGAGITHVVLGRAVLSGEYRASSLANRCATQVQEYFAGKREVFEVPLSLAGSDFQTAVWRACIDIPYGTTATAADVAAAVGRPQSFRSVGTALRACPIAVLVPVHRVVGLDGKPAGTGREAKMRRALLALEQRFKS